MTLKERAKKLKTDIPAVFLAMRRKGTPIVVFWLLVIGLLVKLIWF